MGSSLGLLLGNETIRIRSVARLRALGKGNSRMRAGERGYPPRVQNFVSPYGEDYTSGHG
jgi:hypothetical protein